jgi:hypothetical protein
MESSQLSKSKNPTKLIQIDENTWIETFIDVPDDIARQRFIKRRLESLQNLTGQPT